MTKPKVVFDPFSEEFFNDPAAVFRRLREEAPLYYDDEGDYYVLTRHDDVAAAFKDHESFSSARGCDLAMVRSEEGVPQKSIIFMDPPDHRHMRSLLNKAFTPRAVQAQRESIVEVIEKYLGAIKSDEFDLVQDFSGPFPVEVIARMAGVPRSTASRSGTGSTPASIARPGTWSRARRPCRPTSTRASTTTTWSRSGA